MQQTRYRPNILVSGTPGCGKSTTCELLLRHLSDYQYFNISDFAREHRCYDGYDEARKSHIVDEDRLLDELEPLLRRGGALVDWHVNDIFPERLIDLVVVLRCDNAVLHDRLQKRGYHSSKIEENIDAEIMGVVLQDALDSYVREIVVELQSNDTEQMQQNVDRIAAWEANWVSEHPEGVSNALQQDADSDASSNEADSPGVSDADDSDDAGDSTQDN
ncbi:AaceriACL150Wp [[Ashbya] aceris (nom. inval.)]|nr:AaceriACL150Wp [[Ashbya] aceris (nom. inval.)]